VKIIHKYVLREHAGPLVFALSALTSLMLLNYVAKQLGNLVGKGLDWQVILEFFLLSIPFTVAMTLPMAVLVAVLYAFSRLASENEITALKANGVSMTRLLVPVVLAGGVLTITMIVFNDQVLPRSNHLLRTLQGDIARKKPTFAIKEQIINEVAPNSYFLRTNHLDRETNGMREVTIYDLSDPMRRRTIYADSGSMAFTEDGSDLQLVLYDGFMQEVPKETPTQLQRLYFKTDLVRVPGVANAFERDSNDTYKSDREMSVCELQGEVARYERDYFRSYDDFQRASEAVQKDPRAQVELQPSLPVTRGPTQRSRVRSLGRAYCDGLAYVQRLNLVQRAGDASIRLAAALAPSVAWAQEPPGAQATRVSSWQTNQQAPPSSARDVVQPPVQKGDTVKRDSVKRDSVKRDSVKRDSVKRDSVRSDSAKRATVHPDTIKRDSTPAVAPGVVTADSARRRDEAILRQRAGLPPTSTPPPGMPITAADSAATDSATRARLAGASPSLAPSMGGGITQSANVVMETARSQMLTARSQMNQFAVEIQKKFAISMACVIFVLLGAPIALRFPRGGVGLVIGVSLGVFGLYYVGLIAGEALADRSILTPFWAMWSANILFTVVAIILLTRMGHETATSRGGDLAELFEAFKGLFRRRRRGLA
jgi:lipopolysaccharide export system permease protein